MAVLLLGSLPLSLFSQTTVSCPDYSFCLEVDEENCTIEVRLHGVANVPLLSVDLRIFFWDNAPPIDISATNASFQSTAIWNHFSNQELPLPPVFVSDNFVFIQYFPYAEPNLPPFITDDDCLYLGTIYFDPGELDCDDDIFSYAYQLMSRNGPGPQIWVGNNFPFDYETCTDFTLDCECDDCPQNWGICMLPDPDPCGNIIPVFLTGLEGEEIAGYRFNMVLDPDIVIDEDATRASWMSSNLGGHNWQVKNLSVSYASNGTFLEVFGINSTTGNNATVFFSSEFLMNIYIVPKLGECYKFDENSVDFWFPSGIWKGDNILDGELCENFEWTCPGFEVCFESSTILSGNIERPTITGSCDEGIDFGFPEGKVVARGFYCGYESEFTTLTNLDGSFEIEVFDDADYDIVPAYTEVHRYACGVNSSDMDIVDHVISGQLPEFPFPFSNIAADMNVDSVVTMFDIVYIWRYINEIQYPPGGKWRFLPASQYNSIYVPQNPVGLTVPGYDTMIQFISGLPTGNLNFIAVKMGDVNGSCQQCLEGGSIQEDQPSLLVVARYYASEERLALYYDDFQMDNVTVINLSIDGGNGVKFRSPDREEILNDSELILSGNGNLGASRGWISLRKTGKSLNSGDEIASFSIDEFNFTSELTLTVGELVANGGLYHLNVRWDDMEIVEKQLENEFQHLTIAPNPGFNELQVSLKMENKEGVELRIIDMMGRLVGSYQLNEAFSSINTSSLPPGTYQLLFTSEHFHTTKTWVKGQ